MNLRRFLNLQPFFLRSHLMNVASALVITGLTAYTVPCSANEVVTCPESISCPIAHMPGNCKATPEGSMDKWWAFSEAKVPRKEIIFTFKQASASTEGGRSLVRCDFESSGDTEAVYKLKSYYLKPTFPGETCIKDAASCTFEPMGE